MSECSSAGMQAGAGGGGDGDPASVRAHPDDAVDDRPLTSQELRELALHINMLPGPELSRVIDIILREQPSLRTEYVDDFILDFEKLEPRTLRALERFVLPLFDNLH